MLRRLVAERNPGSIPILYRLTFRDRKLRPVFETFAAHLPETATLIVLGDPWPINLEDVHNVQEAAGQFVAIQDGWFRGRFTQGVEPSGWRDMATQLLYAADALHDRVLEAVRRATHEVTAEVQRQLQQSGSVSLTFSREDEAALSKELLLDRQALLLLGFALENATKGILSRGISATEADPKTTGLTLPASLNSHDLRRLTTDCGLLLTAEEIATLDALSEWVIWRGRYPVPTEQDRFGSHPYPQVKRPDPDYRIAREVLLRLMDRLPASPT